MDSVKLPSMPVADVSDAELISAFTGRDESALSQLYDRYTRAAHGVALGILGHPSDAEEVVQDCFLKVWERPGLFNPQRAGFAAFFMTMIRNRSLDTLRKRRNTLLNTRSLEDEEGVLLPITSEREGPQGHTELLELGRSLAVALERLSAAHRETVTRAVYRGQSREEISLEMKVPVGTVKSRLKYALDKLKVHMKGGDWE